MKFVFRLVYINMDSIINTCDEHICSTFPIINFSTYKVIHLTRSSRKQERTTMVTVQCIRLLL